MDDIKIKRIVSPFFLPLPLYLAFTAVLCLFLARFHGLEAAYEHTRSVVNTLVRFRVNFVSLDLLFSNSCPRYSNYTEEEFCKEHAARLNFQLDKDKVRGNTLVGYAPKL